MCLIWPAVPQRRPFLSRSVGPGSWTIRQRTSPPAFPTSNRYLPTCVSLCSVVFSNPDFTINLVAYAVSLWLEDTCSTAINTPCFQTQVSPYDLAACAVSLELKDSCSISVLFKNKCHPRPSTWLSVQFHSGSKIP